MPALGGEASVGASPPFTLPGKLQPALSGSPGPVLGPLRPQPTSRLALPAEAVTLSQQASLLVLRLFLPRLCLSVGSGARQGRPERFLKSPSSSTLARPHPHVGVTGNPSLGLRRGDWCASSFMRELGPCPPPACLQDHLPRPAKCTSEDPEAPTPPTGAPPRGPPSPTSAIVLQHDLGQVT